MADVEAVGASKEVPAQDAAAAGAAAAKPVKKARIGRPERPSRDVLTKDLADVNAQIAECQKRIQEIRELFDGQRQGRQGVEGEIQEAKRQLAGTVAQFRAVMDQKKALREELAAADEARKRMRDEAKALRDRLPYVKVEQIDEEIAKVEYRMAHMTLTLGEEKKAVQQIRDLSKSKEFVKEYTERMDRISADETLRSGILAKMKEKDEQLNQFKVQEQQQKAAIDALWAKSRTSLDVPALVEERERKHAEIKLHRERIKALHNDFRAKEQEYWGKEQEWRAQTAEDRKKAYEEREAFRKEKEAKRKAWEAENFVEPFTDELIICDQLVAYIQKLGIPGAEEAKEEETKKEVAAEGFGKMVVSKKNRGDEEMDSFFGGLVKEKKKKGSRQRDRGERFVSHSLDAISSFAKIKLTPPTGTGEFEETVEKLKEKKEEYVKLQAAEREKRALALEKEQERKEKGETAEKGEAAEEGKEEAKEEAKDEGEADAEKDGEEEKADETEEVAGDEEAAKKEEGEDEKGEEKEEAKENGKEEAEEAGEKEKGEGEDEAPAEGKGEGAVEEEDGPGKVKKIVKEFEGVLKKPEEEDKAAEGEAEKAVPAED